VSCSSLDDRSRPKHVEAFFLSLAVKDIAASRAFQEVLGFNVRGGNQNQQWLVLQQGTTFIGLFQGMFDGNILTFNPGWDQNAQNLGTFEDVRVIQNRLTAAGLTLTAVAYPTAIGPAHITLTDPDGNAIMIDHYRQGSVRNRLPFVSTEIPRGCGGGPPLCRVNPRRR